MNFTQKQLLRFWAKVDRSETGCWLWLARKNHDGYGTITIAGKKYRASRISWIVNKGVIPEGMCVLHNCPGGDNPSCVNPDHLWLGTKQDNASDAARKGRLHPPVNIGEGNPRARLTDGAIRVIRQRAASGHRGIQKLMAEEYGVSQICISEIVRRKRWVHIA